MNNRTATDTIKGYFYQFDYSIKRILEASNEKDSIVIEGIEDIDIETATETNAVQCKYYSKTEYNHSVIAKPIRLMLGHFIDEKRKGNKVLKYLLYGFYHSGHHKLSLPLSIDNLKNNFLTYTTKGLKKYHHTDIGASDSELNEFISALEIDINAQEYNSQLDVIFNLLKKEFNCTEFESEHFYYNNALNVIKQIAVEPDITGRKISKTDFISKIDYKTILFNQWFLEYKGLTNHFKALKKEYFTGLNSSPFDRFFLIDLDAPKYKRAELKDLIIPMTLKMDDFDDIKKVEQNFQKRVKTLLSIYTYKWN